ncbi:hypothetical protein BH10BAC5_BH10BAC5_07320 [soil metagenome]
MKYYLVIFYVIILSSSSIAQGNGNGRNRIRLAANDAAKEYLLNASRPDYEVNTNLLFAKDLTTSIDLTGGSDFTTLSLNADYGLSNSLMISAGMDFFNSQYNFRNVRKSGIGDGYILLGYHRDINENLSLISQISAKIPFAAVIKNLGTGKPDLHIAAAQISNFGNFGFQTSISLGLLSRVDFPLAEDSLVFTPVQRAIDSLKAAYDYDIESTFTIDISPSINLSENVNMYAGMNFNRNMRLNYNTSIGYLGMGYNVSDAVYLSGGYSFGILNYTGNSFNLGLTYYKAK